MPTFQRFRSVRPALGGGRGGSGRLRLGLLLAAGAGLMLLAKADIQLVNYASLRIQDVATPVLALAARPVAAVRDRVEAIGALLAVHEENRRLREENRRLMAWRGEAARLAVQNRALRALLDVPPARADAPSVTARVVADAAAPFVHTRLLDAGSAAGVEDGMAVIDTKGLVGRVIDVGRRSARVLLITDRKSQVPVRVGSLGDEAILEGDNGPLPALRFLPLEPRFAQGDEVVTSGRGGLIPPGLLVGRIAAIGPERVAVRPAVDLGRLDYLTIVRYRGLEVPGSEAVPVGGGDAAGPATP